MLISTSPQPYLEGNQTHLGGPEPCLRCPQPSSRPSALALANLRPSHRHLAPILDGKWDYNLFTVTGLFLSPNEMEHTVVPGLLTMKEDFIKNIFCTIFKIPGSRINKGRTKSKCPVQTNQIHG